LVYSLYKKGYKTMKKKINSPFRKLKTLLVLQLITLIFCSFAKPEYIEPPTSQTVNLSSAAKKGKVQGKVTTDDGNVLPEVNVIIKGTTNGTATDAFGNFILKSVPADVELVFSYVGLNSVKLTPDFDHPMNVKMAIATIGIQKVVVSPDPATTTLSVLSDEFGITIKGIIDNNPPLYVLDGRVIEKSEFNKFGADRVDNISVLKDSSEIKKYGDKGKNGILIITSKKIVPTLSVNKIGDIQIVSAGAGKEKKIPFTIVEQMPQFPGGEKRMMYYFSNYTKYPKQAKTDKVEGTVEVNFMVNKRGKAERVKILKGANPVLDAEAYRVVNSMPYWTPGKQNSNLVDVYYTIPIEFSLQSADKKSQ
jgi:TonB family protein